MDYFLLDVYGDGEDLYLLRGAGVEDALREWCKIDKRFCESGESNEWEPVNVWLAARGFEVFEIGEVIPKFTLDDFYPAEEKEAK